MQKYHWPPPSGPTPLAALSDLCHGARFTKQNGVIAQRDLNISRYVLVRVLSLNPQETRGSVQHIESTTAPSLLLQMCVAPWPPHTTLHSVTKPSHVQFPGPLPGRVTGCKRWYVSKIQVTCSPTYSPFFTPWRGWSQSLSDPNKHSTRTVAANAMIYMTLKQTKRFLFVFLCVRGMAG